MIGGPPPVPTPMTEPFRVARAPAAIVAVSAWTGLILQAVITVRATFASGGTLVDALVLYFGYFTLLTNLFVALVATTSVLAPRRWFARASVRGCATTAILLVGVAYHLLLREIWDPQGAQKVADVTLHYVTPALAVLWWLMVPPPGRLGARVPLAWAVYPLAYFAYALVRGEWLQAYPYPFIDVPALGYPRVWLNALGLAGVFLVFGYALWGAARWRLRG